MICNKNKWRDRDCINLCNLKVKENISIDDLKREECVVKKHISPAAERVLKNRTIVVFNLNVFHIMCVIFY